MTKCEDCIHKQICAATTEDCPNYKGHCNDCEYSRQPYYDRVLCIKYNQAKMVTGYCEKWKEKK